MGYNSYISNYIADVLLFKTQSLKNVLSENLNNFWDKFNIFMAEYFLDYLDQYDEEYGFLNYTNRPQFPHWPLVPWLSELGYEITLHYDKKSNILNITNILDNGYSTILISGYDENIDDLSITIKSHFELPEIFKVTTTVTSEDSEKPSCFADGMLYNKYKFSTRAYSPPVANSNNNGDIETNEQLLLTRSKFGRLNHVVELQLPKVSLDTNSQQLFYTFSIFTPEQQESNVNELYESISTIDLDFNEQTNIDIYIQNRIYLAQILHELGDGLLEWVEANDQKQHSNLAIEISVSSEVDDNNLNLTIFLTEPSSTKNFLNWLSNNGLELLILLNDHNNLIPKLFDIFKEKNSYISTSDLEKIDFELQYRILDTQFDEHMGVELDLLNSYKYSDFEAKNLSMVAAYSGENLASFGKRTVDEASNTKLTNLLTLNQAYYCYQPIDNKDQATYLLIGTTMFEKY
jgi:hypothetical protein